MRWNICLGNWLCRYLGERCHGHGASQFPGSVATHAVSHHDQAAVGKSTVFVARSAQPDV